MTPGADVRSHRTISRLRLRNDEEPLRIAPDPKRGGRARTRTRPIAALRNIQYSCSQVRSEPSRLTPVPGGDVACKERASSLNK